MLTTIAMLLAAASPAPTCEPAAVQAALKVAVEASGRKDEAAARAAIAPAAACPVTSGATYAAHVLAADLASHAADWKAVRALLADAGLHPEMTLGARAQFLLLRADQGLNDAAAFAADRALTVIADDAKLAASGQKLETFRVATASVTAYRTGVDQGGFHRVLEFIAVPDDTALYPVSILLTDDQGAAAMMKVLNKGATGSGHAWFVDLYQCNSHSSLAPVGPPNGDEPGYAAVKARVVEVLNGKGVFAASPPERGSCFSANWLVPGFGLRK